MLTGKESEDINKKKIFGLFEYLNATTQKINRQINDIQQSSINNKKRFIFYNLIQQIIESLINSIISLNLQKFSNSDKKQLESSYKEIVLKKGGCLASLFQKIDDSLKIIAEFHSIKNFDQKNIQKCSKTKHDINTQWETIRIVLINQWQKEFFPLLPTCKILTELYNPMVFYILRLKNPNFTLLSAFKQNRDYLAKISNFEDILFFFTPKVFQYGVKSLGRKIDPKFLIKILDSDGAIKYGETIINHFLTTVNISSITQPEYEYLLKFLYKLITCKKLTMKDYQKSFDFIKNKTFSTEVCKNLTGYFKELLAKYMQLSTTEIENNLNKIAVFYQYFDTNDCVLKSNVQSTEPKMHLTKETADKDMVSCCIKDGFTTLNHKLKNIFSLEKPNEIISAFCNQEPHKTLKEYSGYFNQQLEIAKKTIHTNILRIINDTTELNNVLKNNDTLKLYNEILISCSEMEFDVDNWQKIINFMGNQSFSCSIDDLKTNYINMAKKYIDALLSESNLDLLKKILQKSPFAVLIGHGELMFAEKDIYGYLCEKQFCVFKAYELFPKNNFYFDGIQLEYDKLERDFNRLLICNLFQQDKNQKLLELETNLFTKWFNDDYQNDIDFKKNNLMQVLSGYEKLNWSKRLLGLMRKEINGDNIQDIINLLTIISKLTWNDVDYEKIIRFLNEKTLSSTISSQKFDELKQKILDDHQILKKNKDVASLKPLWIDQQKFIGNNNLKKIIADHDELFQNNDGLKKQLLYDALRSLRTKINYTYLVKHKGKLNAGNILNLLLFIMKYGEDKQKKEAKYFILDQLRIICLYAGLKETNPLKWRNKLLFTTICKIYTGFIENLNIFYPERFSTKIPKDLQPDQHENFNYHLLNQHEKQANLFNNQLQTTIIQIPEQNKYSSENEFDITDRLYQFCTKTLATQKKYTEIAQRMHLNDIIDDTKPDVQNKKLCLEYLAALRETINNNPKKNELNFLLGILTPLPSNPTSQALTNWLDKLKIKIKREFYRAQYTKLALEKKLNNVNLQTQVKFALTKHWIKLDEPFASSVWFKEFDKDFFMEDFYSFKISDKEKPQWMQHAKTVFFEFTTDNPQTIQYKYYQLKTMLRIIQPRYKNEKQTQNALSLFEKNIKQLSDLHTNHHNIYIHFKFSQDAESYIRTSLESHPNPVFLNDYFTKTVNLLPKNHFLVTMSKHISEFITPFGLRDELKEKLNLYYQECHKIKDNEQFAKLEPIIYWLASSNYLSQNEHIDQKSIEEIDLPQNIIGLSIMTAKTLSEYIKNGGKPNFIHCQTLLIILKKFNPALLNESIKKLSAEMLAYTQKCCTNIAPHTEIKKTLTFLRIPGKKKTNSKKISLMFNHINENISDFLRWAIKHDKNHKQKFVEIRYQDAIIKLITTLQKQYENNKQIIISNQLISDIIAYINTPGLTIQHLLLPCELLNLFSKIITKFKTITDKTTPFLGQFIGRFGDYKMKARDFVLQLPSFETCNLLYHLISTLNQKQPDYCKKYLSSLDEAIYKLAERCNIIWPDVSAKHAKLKKDYQPTEKFLISLFKSKLYTEVLRNKSKYKNKYLDFEKTYNSDLPGKALPKPQALFL